MLDADLIVSVRMITDSKFLSFFFLLKEKRNKKVEGKDDRSARFAGLAPPHCIKGIIVAE